MEHYFAWPTEDEWLLKRGDLEVLYPAPGANDGTSHQIFKPMTAPKQLFDPGYRKYDAIHTQIVDIYRQTRIATSVLYPRDFLCI